MFGLGDNEAPVGARQKIETARRMQKEGRFNVKLGGGGGDVQYPSQVIPLTIIYVFSTVLAMFLTDGQTSPLSGMHFTGIPSVDNFITGTNIHPFTGNQDQDRVLTMFGRGAAFFALAGIIPLLSMVVEKIFFKRTVTPYIVCWGVTILLTALYLLLPDGVAGDAIHSLTSLANG